MPTTQQHIIRRHFLHVELFWIGVRWPGPAASFVGAVPSCAARRPWKPYSTAPFRRICHLRIDRLDVDAGTVNLATLEADLVAAVSTGRRQATARTASPLRCFSMAASQPMPSAKPSSSPSRQRGSSFCIPATCRGGSVCRQASPSNRPWCRLLARSDTVERQPAFFPGRPPRGHRLAGCPATPADAVLGRISWKTAGQTVSARPAGDARGECRA
jgi:hypothetical protein